MAAPELKAEMDGAHLVLLKGDLNYRKLLADRHWPHDADFGTVVRVRPGGGWGGAGGLDTLCVCVRVGVCWGVCVGRGAASPAVRRAVRGRRALMTRQ